MPNVKSIVCLAAMLTPLTDAAVHQELSWFIDRARVRELRSLREFAVAEIVIPEGKHKDTKLRIHTQPFAGLLFDAIDSHNWPRVAITGCVQSGKSLVGFVTPIMYHLFEHRETVVPGVPTMEVGKPKWDKEIKPAIEASQYARLLPDRGIGSRGGWAEEIVFKNGARLRFLAAKGGDERRSSYTTRVVVGTEVDKYDEAAEASREADPVTQMENRMGSYDDDEQRFYMECTVSVEAGRIWQEYQNGTASRIACPCPHCGEYVTPEREHLRGWQEAETKIEAKRLTYFVCPACEHRLTAKDRRTMNVRAKLVHRGQEIDRRGVITGDPPETDTLGFRWNAFNNLFWSPGMIGKKEWSGQRAENEDAAEKELRQFYWAIPWESPDVDTTPLDVQVVSRRFGVDRKGFIPADTKYVTMGVDPGKWVSWWILIAWFADGSGHIVDYGTFEVPSKDQDVKIALFSALRGFRDGTVMEGWLAADGELRLPSQVWVDAGYLDDVVYAFCKESGNRFRPTLGLGAGQHYQRNYSRPRRTGNEVRLIGEQYHWVWRKAERIFVVEVNADHWKSWLQQRLATPTDKPGAMTVYHSSDVNEHLSLAKHFTAEKQEQVFIPGQGTVNRFRRLRKGNHQLDTAYAASAAGHFCGVRLVKAKQPIRKAPPENKPFLTPHGEAYLLTERT